MTIGRSSGESRRGGVITRANHYVAKNRSFVSSATLLSGSYLISCIGDRLWSFVLGMLITKIGGLSWVAGGQLVDAVSKLLLLPVLGQKLDRMDRNRAIQMILAANNICIIVSCVFFYYALGYKEAENQSFADLLLVLAIVANAISRVASEAQKTAFTKDWIVTLIQLNPKAKLSTQNMILTLADQAAAAGAPILCGLIIDSSGARLTCFVLLAWNLVSWLIESLVLLRVYRMTPHLAAEKQGAPKSESAESEEELKCDCFAFLRLYSRQRCTRAAIALALLYMTVLGFDNIAISYGTSQGMGGFVIGCFRAAGAVLGFAGAASYPLLEGKIGLLSTAFIGLALQNVFINFCSLSAFLPGSPFDTVGYIRNHTALEWLGDVQKSLAGELERPPAGDLTSFSQLSPSLVFFFLGITLARYGLWIADPAITEIMQRAVPESERYTFFLVQTALCETFSIIKDIAVILVPMTATFDSLIFMSTTFVFVGLVVYISYYVREIRWSHRRKTEDARSLPNVNENELAPLAMESGEKKELEETEAPLQTNRTEGL